MVNGVTREVQGTSRGTPFIMKHPRLYHTFSFFRHPGPVKRNSFHWHQTQPLPREYHTQCYIFNGQTLVELNPNKLVQQFSQHPIY